MKLPKLTIVPAGAGSGKTHRIQETLSQWVIDVLVQPERIVAVTFTEAAASELRGRIRSGLLSKGRMEDALRLDQAYISTIHGFGLRLLTEFALDGGLTPAPRLLNEDEEKVLLRLALSGTDRTEAVTSNLGTYGYSYDFNSGKGAEDLFRDVILRLIATLRGIGAIGEDPRHLKYALAEISDLYGPTRKAETLKKELLKRVNALLKKFPQDLCTLGKSKTACEELRGDFFALKRASKGDPLDSDWNLWQRLRTLRVSNRQTKLPEDYNDLAQKVMEAADGLLEHPGPLAEASTHVTALLGGSQDCLERYAVAKKEKGLLDYTDMLALGFHLLRQNPSVLQELRSRVDCLVIDEFQDTNPLQFSLLWAMHEAGVPTLVVGDLKQAIMGFQGADSRLLKQLQKKHSQKVDPLTENWRTQPKLMAWINKVGEGLFGRAYTPLTPKAKFASAMTPLEVIEFTERVNQVNSARHTAVRLKSLLEDKTQKVFDKYSGKSRRLRGADIAILCPTHSRLEKYAAALRELGLRPRLAEGGWFESRIIQILYHALSFVADPQDRHAALYLAVTELGQEDLEGALVRLLRGEDLSSAVLAKLRRVGAEAADKPVDTLVAETIAALDLYREISQWPDAVQARANLLRLQGEAAEFLAGKRDALAAGGIHGAGLKSFLAWLAARAERQNGQPEPQVCDEDAIQLMTWHASKGREWPVVAVCALDTDIKPRFPHIGVDYLDFSDISNLLDQARIRISTAFNAPETKERFCAPLVEEAEETVRRLLYVALTRSREKLILEWPSYLEGTSGGKYWNLLQEATGAELKGNRMTVGGKGFDCRVIQGGKDAPEEFEEATGTSQSFLPVIGRRAVTPGIVPSVLTPEVIFPSACKEVGAEEIASSPVLKAYATPLDLELGLPPAERGILLHRCFEIMGKGRSLESVRRATGFNMTEEQFGTLESAVSSFNQWVIKEFSPVSITHEVPILATDGNGSVVSGVIDLLIETSEGFWILDHKSDKEKFEEGFVRYWPQLYAYGKALARVRSEKQLLGLGVHWIHGGCVQHAIVHLSLECTQQRQSYYKIGSRF